MNTRSIASITPSDDRYLDFIRGVNQRYVGRPAEIYLPDTTVELCQVIESLVRARRYFVVRSSGHCLEDFVYNPAVEAVVDLAAFDQLAYDREVDAFEIGTAIPLLRLYEELYRRWGVTIPAGICYSVTPGGHVTGGGWGLLCRQLGLTIDYVCQIEAIHIDRHGTPQLVIATNDKNDPHHDLWWALMGGGGGGLAIVTRFWFRKPTARPYRPQQPALGPQGALPQPPRQVYLSAVSFPWSDIDRDRFRRMLAVYSDYFVQHIAPDDECRALASFMVLTHQSQGGIAVVTQVDATDPVRARQMHDDYLDGFTALFDDPATEVATPIGEFQTLAHLSEPTLLPWLEATRKLGTTNTNLTDPSYRQVYKSSYMAAGFTVAQADSLFDNLTDTSVALTGASITLSSYGGQVNAVSPETTAYPHRASAFKMMWMSLWSDAAEDDDYIAWNRRCYEELYQETGGVPVPNGASDGCYVNYPDRDLNDSSRNRSSWSWAQLYWKDNYPRLQQIKKRYDPLDVFRHRQSIQLP